MQNPDRLRALLDDLGKTNDLEKTRLTAASSATRPNSNPLGLRFSEGDRVLDLLSGKRGLVKSGARDPQTREELFRVELVDATAQYRTREQLEPDPSPAPPAGV